MENEDDDDDYVEDVGQFYVEDPVVYPHTLYKFRVTDSSRGKRTTYNTRWWLSEADAARRVARGEWEAAVRIDSDPMVVTGPAGDHRTP